MSALSRAYRLGAEAERNTIAAWLRAVAYARDDRADTDACAVLLEAAELVENGKHRQIAENANCSTATERMAKVMGCEFAPKRACFHFYKRVRVKFGSHYHECIYCGVAR